MNVNIKTLVLEAIKETLRVAQRQLRSSGQSITSMPSLFATASSLKRRMRSPMVPIAMATG